MQSGFAELPHTADWAVRVWAPDLAGLLAAAAQGMNRLAGIVPADEPRTWRRFEIESPDAESLLVTFLTELLYLAEQESLAFDNFDLETAQHTGSYGLRARMEGAPIKEHAKPVKAVTYHNLQIRVTDHGLEAEVVFDV
jgi:SHS2 domain-containing protein